MICNLDSTLLTECDRVLSKCGRPQAPKGAAYVMIDYPFLYNVANPANTSVTGTREIVGPTDWQFESISVVQSQNAFVRVQLPNGRWLSNILSDLAPNAWAGSFQRAITCPLLIQPGQKFRIITDTTATGASQSNIAILFGGSYRFAVRQAAQSKPTPSDIAANLGRYFQTPNGNILAPEMDLDLDFSEILRGYREGEFRLSTLPITGSIATPGGTTTLSILLDSRYIFSIRRLTFEATFSGGATGTLSCIPRDSSGFSLSTDYVPTTLLQSMPWAHNWEIPGGQSLFFDMQLSNTTGMGSVTFSCNAIGTRRKKK